MRLCRRARVRSAQGACLAVGAPLGWIAIRLAAGVSPAAELADYPGLYAYLFLATLAAFIAFGSMLGTQEEKLLEANRRLDDLSLTDALTGLRNVRYFRARLQEELADAARTGRPLSLLLVDLDLFKSVNDRFGHPMGDRLLEAIAAGMRSAARQGETVARLGGEEFGLLLPDTGEEGARAAAERVRGAVASSRVGLNGRMAAVTASVGIAVAPGPADPGALYRAADRALYEAKRQGRDRAVVAPD